MRCRRARRQPAHRSDPGARRQRHKLHASGNDLTGGIPAALVQLQLDTNKISRLIPLELGRGLVNLEVLFACRAGSR